MTCVLRYCVGDDAHIVPRTSDARPYKANGLPRLVGTPVPGCPLAVGRWLSPAAPWDLTKLRHPERRRSRSRRIFAFPWLLCRHSVRRSLDFARDDTSEGCLGNGSPLVSKNACHCEPVTDVTCVAIRSPSYGRRNASYTISNDKKTAVFHRNVQQFLL